MIRELFRRLDYLFNRRKYDAILAEELAAHEEAAGRRRVGNPLLIREQARDAWGWMWIDHLRQDSAYAWRRFVNDPGFAMTAMLILAFGIGVNLTLFHMLNVAVLRPMAIRDPHTLVRFQRKSPTMSSGGVQYAAVQEYRKSADFFKAWITSAGRDMTWGDDVADRMKVQLVSANYFEQIGYGATLGRVFAESIDEKPDAPPVAVISDSIWELRFQRDPGVINREIRLNGKPVTVIGVAPHDLPSLRGIAKGVFLPIHHIRYFEPGADLLSAFDGSDCDAFVRLPAGMSLDQARERMRPLVQSLASRHPSYFSKGEFLDPIPAAYNVILSGDEYPVVGLLFSIALMVLLAACANLGVLMLARAQSRRREIAVRLTIGAGRGRVVAQLLMEGLLLAVGGTLLSMVFSQWASTYTFMASDAPAHLHAELDWRVAMAAAVLVFIATLAFALFPALDASRHEIAAAVKDGGAQSTTSRQGAWFRAVLITVQVAVSCVLLILSGLFLRGLTRAFNADPGFEIQQIATLTPNAADAGIRGAESYVYMGELKRRVDAMPGVEATGFVMYTPLGNMRSTTRYDATEGLVAFRNDVSPEYFDTMKIRILAGAPWTSLPVKSPDESVIISRTVAMRMYGAIDVVGKPFPRTKPKGTVIGVVEDAHTMQLHAINAGEVYQRLLRNDHEFATMVVRMAGSVAPGAMKGPLLGAAIAVDSRVKPAASSLGELFEERLKSARLALTLLSVIGGVSLFLSSFGLFGVVAFAAASRTREIGIRLALGAMAQRILLLMAGQFAKPILVGIVLGCMAAYGLAQVTKQQLFGLQTLDPPSYIAAVVVFTVASAVACLVPARRATRVDPMVALRHD